MLARNLSPPNAMYRLAAVLSHQGKTSSHGHYFCTILSDNGSAIRFNDKLQHPMLVEKLLKSNKCSEGSKMLIYINKSTLKTDTKRTVESSKPWDANVSTVDIAHLEGLWGGFDVFIKEGLTLTKLRSLMGNQPIQ